MKPVLMIAFLFCIFTSQAQHKVQKIWESDTTLPVPESVLPDTQKGILYVSLVDGDPWKLDGKGEIAQLDMNGKVINQYWVTGLNAPKGMGIWGNTLYAADVNAVGVIDIVQGKLLQRIPVEGSENLNDITVDSKGVVYISDSKANKVFRLQNGKATTYLTNLNTANGVKAIGNDLYILTSKEIYKADANKKLTRIGELQYGGDGIEPVGNGDFIVTSWVGYMYYLHANGKTELLLDTHGHKNTADIGYNPAKRIIYVPTFFGKSVAAYQLQ